MNVRTPRPLALNKKELVPQTFADKIFSFLDVLGVNNNQAAHEQLSSQMETRNEEIMKLWDAHPKQIHNLAIQVSKILKEHLSWPNEYFIPDDTVQLMFSSPIGDLEIEESVLAIEDLIGRKIPDKVWISYSEKKYIELLQFLAGEKTV